MGKNKTARVWTLLSGMLLVVTMAQAVPADSIITFTGQVVSEQDEQPIKALIEFTKLPHGSELGALSSNDNGEFTIYMRAGSSYSIKVGADGYFSHYEQLDVAEGDVVKNYSLSGGAAGFVFTLENLIFEVGKAEINPQSFAELDMLVARLNEYPLMEIQLEGHTDPLGNAQANMQLSQDRVDAVKAYLTGKGVVGTRIKTQAYGGTKPLSTEDTPEAHRMNRRVEVRILKVE